MICIYVLIWFWFVDFLIVEGFNFLIDWYMFGNLYCWLIIFERHSFRNECFWMNFRKSYLLRLWVRLRFDLNHGCHCFSPAIKMEGIFQEKRPISLKATRSKFWSYRISASKVVKWANTIVKQKWRIKAINESLRERWRTKVRIEQVDSMLAY